jgi:hypothetical protein
MPSGTPSQPVDHRGKPLRGQALEGWRRKQAELAAAVEAREDIAALARMVCRLAARELGVPAPDALAVLGARDGASGQEDALRCLRASGINPEPQRQRWAEQAAVQAQHSTGPGWDRDPDHHPEVIALLTSGAPMADVQEKIREAAGRAAREREEQLARSRPGVLWETREGEPVLERGHATPLRPQSSVIHRDVPELGAERTG